jgi:hypothetical protein
MIQEEDTAAAEVLQNVATILATPKGSVPLYREFGVSMEAIDRPIPVAKTLLIAQVTEAVEEFEPRAKVVKVTIEETVEVEINE